MRAFIAAMFAIAVIGVGSWWVLNNEVEYSTADRTSSTTSVRLD